MAQARSEGVNRAESIQAVFEHIHGSPTRKAELLARAHRLWLKTKAEHEARQAAYQPPEVPDEAKMLQELEAHETLAHEDISAEEQAALEASSENVKERYADRISAEQDLVKRKALEREANVFAAAKRKGIEALFAERTKATKEDFTAKRNAIRQAVKQSQFASTAEGSAAIKRMQRVQTFAELNAILKSLPQEIRMKIPPTPSLEGMTQEALTEFLGKRLEQVGGAIENNLQRSFIDAIETALEKAKPKKVSGKPVKGKIGDAQSVVEMINQVKDMTPDQLATTGAAIEKQLTEASTGGEDDAAAMQRKNLLDIFGGLGDRSAADLERAHIILKAILAQGRAQWAALEAARINKQNDQANMIIINQLRNSKIVNNTFRNIHGDNGILALSRAFKLQPGTGWQVDPGILHAPGSLVTYEPQVNSDVFAMFQSEVEGRIIDWSLLTKDVPEAHHHDLDYIVSMLDWDANVNPQFASRNRVFPTPVRPAAETEPEGYRESWVCYGTPHYSAKELTVLPRRIVTVRDAAAYGLILTQGHGTFGAHHVSTPSMIRFGQMTEDELFVTSDAARAGVRIENASHSDPLVILKHFGPGNPDAEGLRR
jgi:hypothetical protein